MYAAFEKVLRSSLRPWPGPRSDLVMCIESCVDCELACLAGAEACLAEPTVDRLRVCIELFEVCAEVCGSTARLLARSAGGLDATRRRVADACVLACAICRQECLRHADQHEHCAVCADACRRCEDACLALISSPPAAA